MRVLVAGTTGPALPDGAWSALPDGAWPARRDGPPAPGGASSPHDVARWWSATPTDATVEAATLAAGGPGFLDALAGVAPEVLAAVVPGSHGVDVPVAVRRDERTGTVYADASQVPALAEDIEPAGPDEPAGPADGRGPTAVRSSAALGHLLALSADAARTPQGRPGRVVLATGGARSHDAGQGLIRALAGATGPRPAADALAAARSALGGVHLVAAVATDAPLLGLHGASAALAAHGTGDVVAQDLERALGAFAHDVASAVATLEGLPTGGGLAGRDLLGTSSSRRLAQLPGAGSGGGTGFAVAALGGRLVPALRLLADDVGLDARISACDLVVVVTDELGPHELGEGTVREVARRAAAFAVPVVVVGRSVAAGRREQAAAGISGAYAWGATPPRALVERVARTWSRT
ncbi:glycerate kinase [Cellulosimicrobium terreum]|nr:glycerate kinase [Cellulosimicrobium terreum]